MASYILIVMLVILFYIAKKAIDNKNDEYIGLFGIRIPNKYRKTIVAYSLIGIMCILVGWLSECIIMSYLSTKHFEERFTIITNNSSEYVVYDNSDGIMYNAIRDRDYKFYITNPIYDKNGIPKKYKSEGD